MLNFFEQSFETLKIKGFKVKLKGKISAAGNSRKRSILYRVGQTSHSTLDLKVLTEIDTVVTFTGVMGLTVSLFY
jgi:ribosomal protein S3|tara:strand:- start:8447 stop:8671 length:225 start_codon:yes stop_codon:yes gene_type:complete